MYNNSNHQPNNNPQAFQDAHIEMANKRPVLWIYLLIKFKEVCNNFMTNQTPKHRQALLSHLQLYGNSYYDRGSLGLLRRACFLQTPPDTELLIEYVKLASHFLQDEIFILKLSGSMTLQQLENLSFAIDQLLVAKQTPLATNCYQKIKKNLSWVIILKQLEKDPKANLRDEVPHEAEDKSACLIMEKSSLEDICLHFRENTQANQKSRRLLLSRKICFLLREGMSEELKNELQAVKFRKILVMSGSALQQEERECTGLAMLANPDYHLIDLIRFIVIKLPNLDTALSYEALKNFAIQDEKFLIYCCNLYKDFLEGNEKFKTALASVSTVDLSQPIWLTYRVINILGAQVLYSDKACSLLLKSLNEIATYQGEINLVFLLKLTWLLDIMRIKFSHVSLNDQKEFTAYLDFYSNKLSQIDKNVLLLEAIHQQEIILIKFLLQKYFGNSVPSHLITITHKLVCLYPSIINYRELLNLKEFSDQMFTEDKYSGYVRPVMGLIIILYNFELATAYYKIWQPSQHSVNYDVLLLLSDLKSYDKDRSLDAHVAMLLAVDLVKNEAKKNNRMFEELLSKILQSDLAYQDVLNLFQSTSLPVIKFQDSVRSRENEEIAFCEAICVKPEDLKLSYYRGYHAWRQSGFPAISDETLLEFISNMCQDYIIIGKITLGFQLELACFLEAFINRYKDHLATFSGFINAEKMPLRQTLKFLLTDLQTERKVLIIIVQENNDAVLKAFVDRIENLIKEIDEEKNEVTSSSANSQASTTKKIANTEESATAENLLSLPTAEELPILAHDLAVKLDDHLLTLLQNYFSEKKRILKNNPWIFKDKEVLNYIFFNINNLPPALKDEILNKLEEISDLEEVLHYLLPLSEQQLEPFQFKAKKLNKLVGALKKCRKQYPHEDLRKLLTHQVGEYANCVENLCQESNQRLMNQHTLESLTDIKSKLANLSNSQSELIQYFKKYLESKQQAIAQLQQIAEAISAYEASQKTNKITTEIQGKSSEIVVETADEAIPMAAACTVSVERQSPPSTAIQQKVAGAVKLTAAKKKQARKKKKLAVQQESRSLAMQEVGFLNGELIAFTASETPFTQPSKNDGDTQDKSAEHAENSAANNSPMQRQPEQSAQLESFNYETAPPSVVNNSLRQFLGEDFFKPKGDIKEDAVSLPEVEKSHTPECPISENLTSQIANKNKLTGEELRALHVRCRALEKDAAQSSVQEYQIILNNLNLIRSAVIEKLNPTIISNLDIELDGLQAIFPGLSQLFIQLYGLVCVQKDNSNREQQDLLSQQIFDGLSSELKEIPEKKIQRTHDLLPTLDIDDLKLIKKKIEIWDHIYYILAQMCVEGLRSNIIHLFLKQLEDGILFLSWQLLTTLKEKEFYEEKRLEFAKKLPGIESTNVILPLAMLTFKKSGVYEITFPDRTQGYYATDPKDVVLYILDLSQKLTEGKCYLFADHMKWIVLQGLTEVEVRLKCSSPAILYLKDSQEVEITNILITDISLDFSNTAELDQGLVTNNAPRVEQKFVNDHQSKPGL